MMPAFTRPSSALLLIGGIGLLSPFAAAIEIRAYDPLRHDRFVDFPSDLTSNSNFYLAEEDWSGFGWCVQDTRKHFTLISPKHFVGARHFRPAIGQEIRFVNRQGVAKTYTVAARHDILNDEEPAVFSDLFVGELAEIVGPEDEVSIVPFLNLPAEADYVGQAIVASGRNSRAGEGTIATIEDFGGESGSVLNVNRGLTFLYVEPGTGGDECRLVDGDSGGPSAVLEDKGFALVGTHSAIAEESESGTTTQTNFDVFAPHYLAGIDAVLAEDGYSVKRSNESQPNLALSLAESADPVLSSDGVDYVVTISNAFGGELARNLHITLTCDAGANFASYESPEEGWNFDQEGETLTALRGTLESEASTSLIVTLNLPDEPEGAVSLSVNLQADGSETLATSESTEVMQSYQSWAAGLSSVDLLADPDGDGVNNQLEYALGTNGGRAEENGPLDVSFSGNAIFLGYSQRAFAVELGAELVLESSPDLLNWTKETETSMTVVPLNYQLETVTVERPVSEREFFRLRLETAAAN
ncbi:hypothetical protein QEH58_12725 [Roseibacillus persicicus]|nr:hypothetical protein [Roseibacillus persicicus]